LASDSIELPTVAHIPDQHSRPYPQPTQNQQVKVQSVTLHLPNRENFRQNLAIDDNTTFHDLVVVNALSNRPPKAGHEYAVYDSADKSGRRFDINKHRPRDMFAKEKADIWLFQEPLISREDLDALFD